tara:strand:- start:230 stop:622 length:393 start_codon:yes stop_codon:yes gene_type:complete
VVNTYKKQIIEITDDINNLVKKSQIDDGLLNLSILHTSCSLMIQENADFSVLEDIKNFLKKLVPENIEYLHNSEGPDDMPSHIKSLLTQTNLTLSIRDSEIILGTWQGIFLLEHRDSNRKRSIFFHLIGE